MVESQEALKLACARIYESDLATTLLGSAFHPGGLRLTDRLADLAGIGRADQVVDVACGRGATAIHLLGHAIARSLVLSTAGARSPWR